MIMEPLIISPRNIEDKQLLLNLAKRLKASVKSIEEIEDEILGKMIEKGLESGLADKNSVLQKLNLK
jgi:hypothetical protein